MFPWLPAARDRWLARTDHVETLLIRAHLAGAVTVDALDGQTLEGPLTWAVVLLATDEQPSDVFAGVSPGYWTDLPTPLADVEIAGRPVARCSEGRFPEGSREGVRRLRKRPHPEALRVPGGKGVIVTQGGPYKMLDLPVLVRFTPVMDWWVRADRARLEELLRAVHGIGFWCDAGVGAVLGWEILETAEDRSLTWQGLPTRPLPVTSRAEAARLYPGASVRECGARAPYWHRATRHLCAVPT